MFHRTDQGLAGRSTRLPPACGRMCSTGVGPTTSAVRKRRRIWTGDFRRKLLVIPFVLALPNWFSGCVSCPGPPDASERIDLDDRVELLRERCDENELFSASVGTCEEQNLVFATANHGFSRIVYWFDGESGKFEAYTTSPDFVWFCSTRYWPRYIECSEPVVSEVLCSFDEFAEHDSAIESLTAKKIFLGREVASAATPL